MMALGPVDAASPMGGGRWLTADRTALRVHERTDAPGRAVRALANACDIQLVEGRAGAWAVWFTSPVGCSGRDARGPVSVLRVWSSGQTAAEVLPFADEPMSRVRARLDAGRLVVEGWASDSSDSATVAVLDLEGAILAKQPAEAVVCPLMGCASVTHPRGSLRFAPLGDPTADWQLSGLHGRSIAHAVRGDRVLVAHRSATNMPLELSIIDFGRRRVESVHDQRDRARSATVDVWREAIDTPSFRVAPSDRGFVYAGRDAGGRFVAREVDCAP